ncbi:SLAM family member 5-like isoform X2 [Sapajus apella]|uniref:SLAM family member 5-like isoform X2 n=1 Tax=Sapajus apella TaxID=9515 RepID=A0A6J3GF84_SAPAP|nr:SLAM family member 5-like isoform X2 [Sapajus apella]
MGSHSKNRFFCWASGLLVFINLFLSVCSTEAYTSEAHDSALEVYRKPIHLKVIRGGSVLFNVIEKLRVVVGAELQEVSWALGTLLNYTQVLQVRKGADSPIWLSLQDKFKQRVHVPSMWSLRIENLAPEDSGQYMAMIRSTRGKMLGQVFYLSVYEPVPHPGILAKLLSITPGLCNITLQCRAPGATEDLKVTWVSKGLLRELEQSKTPGPALNPWTLAVSLPLCQCNTHLTCVVSNQVDKKAAILDVRKVCVQETAPHKQDTVRLLPGLLGDVAGVMLVLGTGLYLLKTCRKKKKMKIRRGGELQENHVFDDDVNHYEDLRLPVSQKDKDKGIGEQYLEKEEPLTAIYSEVHYHCPGRAIKIIQLEEAKGSDNPRISTL